MANPYSSAAIAGRIQGLREAKAAFQRLPEITRDALNEAVFVTVSEIARLAKARVLASPSVRTRSLYNAIGFSTNPNNGRGRVGVQNVTTTISNPSLGAVGRSTVKIRGNVVSHGGRTILVNPRRYAHLVEFGSRHAQAEPFMFPAAAAQKQPFLDRCMRAGKQIEQRSAMGTGLL